MHLFDYVATSNESSFNVELGYSGPIRVLLDAFSYLLISKNIDVLVFFDAVELEDLDDVVTESAPWHLSIAFHEQHGVVVRNPLCKLLIQFFFIHRGFLRLCLEITVTLLAIIVIMIMVVTRMETTGELKHG